MYNYLNYLYLFYTPHFSMGLTSEMLRPFLEGWTLKQIIEAKRLFMVDLKILEDLPTKDDWPVSVCCTFCCLFILHDTLQFFYIYPDPCCTFLMPETM